MLDEYKVIDDYGTSIYFYPSDSKTALENAEEFLEQRKGGRRFRLYRKDTQSKYYKPWALIKTINDQETPECG